MKKRNSLLLSSLFLLLILCLLNSCTHNNGDIGPLFGNWKLISITTESGQPLPTPEGQMFMAFQNSTVRVTVIRGFDNTQHDDSYGNYTLTDNTLRLTFYEEEDPYVLKMIDFDLQTDFQVLKLTGKELRLARYGGAQTAIYEFKKW